MSLDASTLGLADGASVSSWSDNSGGGPSASAAGGSRPVFVASAIGGRPAVRLDGVDDQLRLGAGFADLRAGVSVFMVARPSSLQSGTKMMVLGDGSSGGMLGLGRAGSSSGLQYFTTDAGGSFGWFDTASGMVVGESAVFSVVQGAGAVGASVPAAAWRNGAEIGGGQVFVPPVQTRDQGSIGGSFWASDGMFGGDVAEVLVYDRALSSAEVATVTAHLAAKYGLAVSAPAPAAPADLAATPGDGSVSLSWGAVSAASSYRVSRAHGGGAFEVIDEVGSVAYQDTAVTNGVAYSYRVSALGVGGESAASATVGATPQGEPEPPAGVPLDGLVMSLDASTLGLADGASVSSWSDNSGGGPSASAAGGSRPVFVASAIGGRPAVRLDGVDDQLRLGAGFADLRAGVSVFMVARPSSLQSGTKMMVLGDGSSGGMLGLGRAGSSSGLQYFTTDAGGSFGWFDTASGMVVGESAVFSVVQGAGAVGASVPAAAWRNGAEIGGGQVFVPPVQTRDQGSIGGASGRRTACSAVMSLRCWCTTGRCRQPRWPR